MIILNLCNGMILVSDMILKLIEKFGSYCLHSSQGHSMFLLMKSAIDMQKMLEIDFRQVRLISSDFLEASIGEMMKKYNKQKLYTYVKFLNVKARDIQSIEFSIDFYSKYHKDSKYKDLVDLKNNVESDQQEPIINAPEKNIKPKRKQTSRKNAVTISSLLRLAI